MCPINVEIPRSQKSDQKIVVHPARQTLPSLCRERKEKFPFHQINNPFLFISLRINNPPSLSFSLIIYQREREREGFLSNYHKSYPSAPEESCTSRRPSPRAPASRNQSLPAMVLQGPGTPPRRPTAGPSDRPRVPASRRNAFQHRSPRSPPCSSSPTGSRPSAVRQPSQHRRSHPTRSAAA